MKPLLGLLLALLIAAPDPALATVLVRMQISAGGAELGDIDLELYDAVAPLSVANFLAYLDRRDYDETLWHRSEPGFVIQGGGYWPASTAYLPSPGFISIPRDPAVPNEFSLSNLRGTIAMAKLSGNPNSATSEWFINLVDNTGLDTNNGGFTVFGQVVNGTMSVVDAIAALPRYNASSIHGSAFGTLPLKNYPDPGTGTIHIRHLARIRRTLRVAEGQCGDVNNDQVVDDRDLAHYRLHLADATAAPFDSASLSKCSVAGAPDSCDLLDVTVMRRDLAFYTPRIQTVCPAAAP